MLSVLLLLLQSSSDPQQIYDGRLRQTDVRLPRIDASMQIDGDLTEDAWRRAAILKGFTQYRPVDSRPAADSTEILAFYAPDAIYFGIRAFEAHGAVVRATLADRDNIDSDDHIQILLDTFNDRRRALLFAVNPLGVQQDGVRSEGLAGAAGGQNAGFRFDGVIDLNPDYIYQSHGHVTPWGYEVEVRIPFKSLRYQSGATQDWGIQFIRTTQHTGYEDTWAPVVRASASFLIQSGTVKDLSDLRRGLVMDISPEFTSRIDGEPVSPDRYRYRDIHPELGVNVRWGVTQNLSAAGTINPDFSQVEADVGQVTVNQRFALFFPEKRPFFLEGLEQFDTPNALIYTRRIIAPVGGAKLTGKVGGTAVAYIGAVDDNLATDAPSSGDHPIVNLLRLRRDLGSSSTIGLAYTDRIVGSFWNRVVGADARAIWKKIWFSDGQIVGSWTKNGSGVRAGELWDVTLYDRTGYSYGDYAGYQVNSGGTLTPFVVPHGRYNLWGGDIGFNTPNRALTVNGDVGAGQGVIFAEAAESRGLNAFLGVTWKPTPGLRVDAQLVHQRLSRAADGSWFSTANIPRLKVEYQLTRDIFFRYVGQYAAQQIDALRDPETGDSLVVNGTAQPRATNTDSRNDWLFSYSPTPGTVFFFGYGSSLSEPDPFSFRQLTRTGDGFFLKASYLFRM